MNRSKLEDRRDRQGEMGTVFFEKGVNSMSKEESNLYEIYRGYI